MKAIRIVALCLIEVSLGQVQGVAWTQRAACSKNLQQSGGSGLYDWLHIQLR